MERKTIGGLSDYRAGTPRPASSVLVAIVLGVADSAWLISARLTMPDMRVGVLTRAAMTPRRGAMGIPGSTSMGLSLGAFIATWTVMMVAMMIPSFIPAGRTFDAWARTTGQSGGTKLLFITGYLLVWSTIGGVAYLIVQALDGWPPAGSTTALSRGSSSSRRLCPQVT